MDNNSKQIYFKLDIASKKRFYQNKAIKLPL